MIEALFSMAMVVAAVLVAAALVYVGAYLAGRLSSPPPVSRHAAPQRKGALQRHMELHG